VFDFTPVLGLRNTTLPLEGAIQYFSPETAAGKLYELDASIAYGTTLPDSIGTNDATLVNTELVYIPALADGSDDAAGIDITNPPDLVHNGGPHKVQTSVWLTTTSSDASDTSLQGTHYWYPLTDLVNGVLAFRNEDETYAIWLISEDFYVLTQISDLGEEPPANPYWEGVLPSLTGDYEDQNGATGTITVAYRTLDWSFYATHANFDNNVVKKCTADGFIAECVTWPIDYDWTASAYTAVNNWAGDDCLTSGLIPYPVTAGTGIGPDGSWYTPDGTNIYLVEDA